MFLVAWRRSFAGPLHLGLTWVSQPIKHRHSGSRNCEQFIVTNQIFIFWWTRNSVARREEKSTRRLQSCQLKISIISFRIILFSHEEEVEERSEVRRATQVEVRESVRRPIQPGCCYTTSALTTEHHWRRISAQSPRKFEFALWTWW